MKKFITKPLMVLILFAIAIKSNAQWNLTGNSNATTTSILGTTNAIPLNLTTNNVSRLVIDANGKIGIGTSTPINILTVKGSGGTPAAAWVNSGAPLFAGFGEQITGNADYILSMASSLAGGRPVFIGRRSKGTLAVPAVVANNDFLMSFLSSGYDGSAFQNPAGIDFYVDGTPSAGNVPARISFVTGSNSSNRAERLKIGNTGDITVNTNQLFVQRATGNVGLGTITPAARLDAKTTNGYVAQFNGGNQMYMGLFENDIYRGYLGSYSGAAEDVDFGTGSGNTTGKLHLAIQGAPKFTVDANGNIGVGTTTPAAKMDVVGNIKIADGTQGLGKVLTSDANGLASWNTLSSIVETDPKVGILSNNRVPKWSGSTLVDGNITDNGSNVGIGTTTPAAKLDVKSTGPYVAQFNGAAPMYMGLFENDVYRGYLGSYAGAAEDVDFGTGSGNTTGKLHLTVQANPKLTIDATGKVGIGTTTPNHLMHINGGDLFVQSSSGLIRFGYEGTNEWQMATTGGGADLRWYTTTDGGATIIPRHYFSQNGNMGVGGFSGTGVPLGRLDVIGAGTTSSTNNLILRNSNLDTIMRVRDDGRIGIGYNGTSYGRTVNLGGTGINFYTASEAAFGGAVFPTDTSLVLWSNSGANNYLVLQPSWGNVGIGTYSPKAKLHVNTGTAASLAGGGYMISGAITGRNIVFDTTQIIARNAGAAADLSLNNNSGNTLLNATGSGSVGIGTSAPIARLDVLGTGATSTTNTFALRNSLGDTLLRMRNDGRMGIGYNGTSYGRTVNLGGTGINFYTANEAAFGGAVFPTDTSLVLWSNSGANNYLVLQPSWGNTGIGTYTPNSKLHVNGNVTIGPNSFTAGGQFELSLDQGRKPSTSTWTIVSDARLKNIDGSYTKGLEDIMKLNPITYHYKNVGKRQFEENVLNTQAVGFTAQDVQKVFPEAVGTDADGYLNLNIHPILIAQVNAIKQQQAEIETLKAKVAKVDELQKQIDELKDALLKLVAQKTPCTTSK